MKPRLVAFLAFALLAFSHRLTADDTPVQRRRPGTAAPSVSGDQKQIAFADLIAALNDPNLTKRRMAAQQLGGLGAKATAAVPALLERAQDRQGTGDAGDCR